LKSKKTYLVISPFFPSENSHNGSYVFDGVNELKKQTNFHIEIVKVVSLFSSEKDYEFKGFQVKIFKMCDLPFFIFPGLLHFINKKRILSFLSSKKVDDISIIHAHVTYPSAYFANAIGDKCNAKTMVQHHGLDVLQLLNGRNGFLRRIWKNNFMKKSINQLNKIDVNIGVSEKVLEKLREFKSYNPISEYVLYNGVDTSKFFPKKLEKTKEFTIGCVANFWKIKDHISLIRAVEMLLKEGEQICSRLIGEGATLQHCKDYVKTNKLSENIVFEREIKHEKLNDFFNEIDLFVMPSYYEALGCVYLESWATNTPFIAIKGQGISELIPDEKKSFYLAEKQNPISLKEKIQIIIEKDEKMQFDYSLSIKNTIEKFLQKNRIDGDN